MGRSRTARHVQGCEGEQRSGSAGVRSHGLAWVPIPGSGWRWASQIPSGLII